MLACFLKFFTDAKVSTKVSLFGWAPSIVSWKDFMKEYCAPARRDDAGGLCSLVLVLQGVLSLTNSRKERTMDTNHPATAGPNVAINVDILKTSIDDNTNTFNDLRRLGSAAAASG